MAYPEIVLLRIWFLGSTLQNLLSKGDRILIDLLTCKSPGLRTSPGMVWPMFPFYPCASGFCQEVPNGISGHIPQNTLEHFVPSRSSLSLGTWCNCIFLYSMFGITIPFIQSIVNCAAFFFSFFCSFIGEFIKESHCSSEGKSGLCCLMFLRWKKKWKTFIMWVCRIST